MKIIGALTLASGLFVAAVGLGQDGANKKDLDKLRGTWLIVSVVYDGKPLVDEKAPDKGPVMKLIYDGTKWMVKGGDETVANGIFKIDATKTPKEIDILDDADTKNDNTKLGIYELDGDNYKFCLAPAGKPRPADFTSKKDSGHTLGVTKREKQ
jgi:uncharacterized protein (TIGR03067 family)